MAGTVIDTLVLELGLDPRKFTEEQRAALDSLRKFQEEGTKQGKQIESQTKRLNETLLNFKRDAMGTFATVFGAAGIKEFINYVSTLDASTGRLGRTMNMSAAEVSQWQSVIQQVGGTAEEANAALAGLSGEINRFNLTGQSSILGVLSQLNVPGGMYRDGKPKTSSQLLRELSTAVQGRDPAEATALLSMIPGMTQGMVNALLEGPQALDKRLESARAAGGTTAQSAAEAAKYQESLALLTRSMTELNRSVVTLLTPAIVAILDAIRKLFNGPDRNDPAFKAKLEKLGIKDDGEPTIWERMASRLTGLPTRGGRQYQLGTPGYTTVPTPAPPAAAAPAASPAGGPPTAKAVEAYIRQQAVARGIDPEVAVKVWSSEGRMGYVGDQGSSFGPFQLHYGGMAPGGNSGTGLGDEFTRRTGLHARDPSTWQSQVDFSLDEARKGGWGPWHGWRGMPFAGIGRGAGLGADTPGAGATNNISIGKIEINAPQAKDADGISKEIGPALRRQIEAGGANYGGI